MFGVAIAKILILRVWKTESVAPFDLWLGEMEKALHPPGEKEGDSAAVLVGLFERIILSKNYIIVPKIMHFCSTCFLFFGLFFIIQSFSVYVRGNLCAWGL